LAYNCGALVKILFYFADTPESLFSLNSITYHRRIIEEPYQKSYNVKNSQKEKMSFGEGLLIGLGATCVFAGILAIICLIVNCCRRLEGDNGINLDVPSIPSVRYENEVLLIPSLPSYEEVLELPPTYERAIAGMRTIRGPPPAYVEATYTIIDGGASSSARSNDDTALLPVDI
jgi:hypothetical protein